MSGPARTVLVVGNGAAGTLVVIALLRAATTGSGPPLRLTWVGDGPVARGVAYGTPRSWHRLNVPTATLSLDAAEHDFPSWVAGGRDGDGNTDTDASPADPDELRDAEFAARWSFGSYLAETLARTRAAADPARVRLDVEPRRAVDAGSTADGVRVDLDDGTRRHAEHLVVVPGPFPSVGVPGATDAALAHPDLVTDPWSPEVHDDPPDGEVLLLGTGLTAVDVALSVARARPAVRLRAVSRTGLLPRDHAVRPGTPTGPALEPGPDVDLDDIVAAVDDRIAAEPGRWRDVVDGLRPVTAALWRGLSHADRVRFLRTDARRWEVHRHRMAPPVAREVDALRTHGTLTVGAGRVHEIDVVDGRLRVRLDAGPAGPEEVLWPRRVVTCTGAEEDVTRVADPLVAGLLAAGDARPHPLRLGFDVDDDGALRPIDRRRPRVHTVGSTRRGECYETTSVPEIRDQAEALARVLTRPSTTVPHPVEEPR